MVILLTITAILLFIGMIVVVPVGASINDVKWWHIVIGIIVECVLLISCACTLKEATNLNIPTAIDVYRGNTTLKITYVDSIPQDTIVVFK